ncbi:MAG: putative peptidase [Syntrophorhabdus sp. PtaU1.Bin153]|nr:MAG: putative peptidase [Syntrophorhabdus sp. PtaU1.Bin153]
MKEKRAEKVLGLMETMGLDACLLKGMDNIFYLTGFRGSEGTLFVTKGDIILLTDFRYITYAQGVTKGIKIVELREKKNVLGDLCEQYAIRRIGFDSLHTPFYLYKKRRDLVPNVEFVPLDNEIEDIRKQKEPAEIDMIVRAIDVATKAFTEVFEQIRPGRTEKEIANELDYAMRRLGAEGPSFATIVASGARAALPHAEPTDKPLCEGETVIIDFGAQVDGYCSDETCTLSIGEVNGKLQDIFTIVNEAKELGMKTIRPGIPVKNVDTVVRGFIEEAGYGDFFRHGTGHGVGIAVHEAPSINSTGEGIFEEGMVITVEPGIYIPNLGGVRLEDMVLVGSGSAKVLTHIRKDILSVNT